MESLDKSDKKQSMIFTLLGCKRCYINFREDQLLEARFRPARHSIHLIHPPHEQRTPSRSLHPRHVAWVYLQGCRHYFVGHDLGTRLVAYIKRHRLVEEDAKMDLLPALGQHFDLVWVCRRNEVHIARFERVRVRATVRIQNRHARLAFVHVAELRGHWMPVRLSHGGIFHAEGIHCHGLESWPRALLRQSCAADSFAL